MSGGRFDPFRDFGLRSVRGRRLVTAVLVGIAVLCGLHAVRPSSVATRAVWVAAHDLPGGDRLTPGDLRTEALPVTAIPANTLAASARWTGRMVAAPVRSGEPITDVRLLSPDLLAAADRADDLAIPVRISDGAAALSLTHAGDRVDVLAGPDPAAGAAKDGSSTVASDVLVLATPTVDDSSALDGSSPAQTDGSGLVILAATAQQAVALAAVGTLRPLTLAVRRQRDD